MAEYFNYRLTEDAILYFSNLFETSQYIPEKGKPGDPRYNLKLLLAEGSADLEELLSVDSRCLRRAYQGRKEPFQKS